MGVLTCFAKIMVNDPRPTKREEKSEGVILAGLRLENVTKMYWSLVALNNISFENRDGELLTLLGPSGAGKTTSLNFQRSFPFRILIGRIDQKTMLQPKL